MKTSSSATLPIPLADHRKVRIVAPYPITYRFKVESEYVGKSLLEMMATKFPYNSQKAWRRRIVDGRVCVDNQPVNPDFSLESHHSIFHHNPAVVEPAVPDEVRVLEETQDYLAVFKPAPMPMHPGGRYNKNSLKVILEEMGFTELKITHRLDAVTSGLVLFAKNKAFAKTVMQAFTNGEVEKEYRAKVAGVPTQDHFEIRSNIRRKQGFVFESGRHVENGVEGHTQFEVVERFEDSATVKCMPITGRTHQIRLHLAEAGFPIIDDPIYGPNGDTSSLLTQNVGISLVSTSLRFPSLGIELGILI